MARDPRVLRQCRVARELADETVVVGLGDYGDRIDGCLLRLVPPPVRGWGERLPRLATVLGLRMAPWVDRIERWYAPSKTLMAIASGVQANLYIANDWPALPVAAQLARLNGGLFGYDSHEWGPGEHNNKMYWRLLFPGLVRRVEKRWLEQAAFFSTVSDGIADLYMGTYALAQKPSVIRNVPAFQETLFRPTGECIEVLYHGIFNSNRGLEALIASVAEWRSEFMLVLRGWGNPAYEQELRELAQSLGVSGRVRFEPPVPPDEIVQAATAADIGLFVPSGQEEQSRYVLPNKVFEYMMAGLAVCVSDMPDMARLVLDTNTGVTCDGGQPSAIAAAINGLSRTQIDRFKTASLEAAKRLCAEAEDRQFNKAMRVALGLA